MPFLTMCFPQVVRIMDKRVGLLYYFFLLGIVGYIAGYTILFQHRYLKLETPIGSVRTSLMSVRPSLHVLLCSMLSIGKIPVQCKAMPPK